MSSGPRPRSLLVPLLLLAVAGLAGLGALGVSSLARLQDRRARRALEQQAAREAAGQLLQAFDALSARHPELGLSEPRIEALASASPREQVRELEEARRSYGALEQELLRRLTGLSPGEEAWASASAYWSFSAGGFRDLQDRVAQPGTAAIGSPPAVTGEEAADRRMVALAESRGYRLRRQVDPGLLQAADSGHSLHPLALEGWRRLQEESVAAGVPLRLVSGYRSPGRQREIFLSELRAAGQQALGRPWSPEEIAAGQADAAVLEILKYSSIPGYSKHHSGCALDLADASSGLDYTEFARTDAHRWLSAHNYLNAKRFGFVPSYPAGAQAQGPDPEPWEYLWVGEEPLRRLLPQPSP